MWLADGSTARVLGDSGVHHVKHQRACPEFPRQPACPRPLVRGPLQLLLISSVPQFLSWEERGWHQRVLVKRNSWSAVKRVSFRWSWKVLARGSHGASRKRQLVEWAAQDSWMEEPAGVPRMTAMRVWAGSCIALLITLAGHYLEAAMGFRIDSLEVSGWRALPGALPTTQQNRRWA